MDRTLSALLLATTLLMPCAALAQTAFSLPGGQALGVGTLNAAGTGKADLMGTALNGTTPRDLRARFADQINVKDFGALGDGSTDDTAAFNAAFSVAADPLRIGGAAVYAPAATYHIAGQIAATFAGTQMTRFFGDGLGSILLIDGSGPQFFVGAVPGATGGVDVQGLLFRHNGTTTQAGTGLTVVGSGGTINVQMSDVWADGVAPAGSWLIGYEMKNVNLHADHVEAHLPNYALAANTTASYGMEIKGTPGATSAGNIYSIDSKILNSVFQGGQAGIHLTGPWQGMFVTNTEALGGNYGIRADNVANDQAELLMLDNFHANSHISGVYDRGANQVFVRGGLFLRLAPNGDAYKSVDISGVQNVIVSNTVYNGTGTGTETDLSLPNNQFVQVSANQAETLGGPFADLTGSSYSSVTGNTFGNFPNYSGAKILGCGGAVQCIGNNYDAMPDINFDGTNFQFAGNAAFLPQVFVKGTTLSYGFQAANGSLSNAVSQSASGVQSFGSGSTAVSIGSSGNPITLQGPASGPQITATTLVFDPLGTAPTTSSSACTAGQAAWATGYLYICVATNTWQRAPLSGF